MSGFQEILLILIIILAIFFIPRVMARHTGPPPPLRPAVRRLRRPMSGRLRLAILVSALWPLAALLYLRPWEGGWVRFAAIGGLPLVLCWGLYWVMAGFQSHSRSGGSMDRRR